MANNLFCSQCGQELNKMSNADMKAIVLKAMAVVSQLVGEFDNPDNNPNQRSIIEEAKEFLKS